MGDGRHCYHLTELFAVYTKEVDLGVGETDRAEGPFAVKFNKRPDPPRTKRPAIVQIQKMLFNKSVTVKEGIERSAGIHFEDRRKRVLRRGTPENALYGVMDR